ncbi:SDR family oxidoreductase [Streptomyces sp. NPDC005485]|uniref:SDR family oxidoreductase n=1 Tax=Streptomyces sp. NPDC005485 TaxID=3155591 RepID=UPI0033AB1DBA
MAGARKTVLVVGATGSIGRHAVAEALANGHRVRALVRSASRASMLPDAAEIVVGDVTRPDTLPQALDGVDAIVWTLGSSGGSHTEAVDYAGVLNILKALDGRSPHIALMTAIGLTGRLPGYADLQDWKRRSERLVRASDLPYTIVRPGWFGLNDADQHRPVFLQGDKRRSGSPSDGVIAREDIAKVLVAAVECEESQGRTLELVAESGVFPDDLRPMFEALEPDAGGSLDGVGDLANMPLDKEPSRVAGDLDAVRKIRTV